MRTTNDVLIGVLKPSAKLKDEICEMADVHLRFISINGTLNLYGIKPYAVIHNISPLSADMDAEEGEKKKKKGYHKLKFTPLV